MLKTSLLVLLLNQALTQATNIQCLDSNNRIQLPTDLEPPSFSYAQCQRLKVQCLGETVTEQLVGGFQSFTCPDQSTGNISFVRRYGDTETQITNGGRFTISGQTLTISNILPEDEGEYRCSSSAGCLIVSGLAHFRTCESNFSFAYTQVPTLENSCSQNVNVTEGEPVTLDTRLLFGERGYCQCIEDITLFRVRRAFDSPPIFGCNEVVKNCNTSEGFIVSRGSEQPYDFSLMLTSVTMSSIYYVEVEARQPGLGSRRRFWKIFDVTVYPAPPMTTMATMDTTAPQTTVMDTTGVTIMDTATTQTQRPTVSADNSEAGPIAGGVISGVVVIGLLILVVLLLVIGILVYKNHSQTHSAEHIYTEIVIDSRKRSQSNGRSSVFINVKVDLPSQLESTEQVNA